jgi:superfamily II DNA/RNA helicase
MALLPVTAKRQNLLFSATFSGEIKKLADQLLNAPQLIEVAKRNTAAETVTQSAYKVPAEAKRALLEHLVRSRGLNQVLCFMRTKHGASRLARQLEKDGLVADAIHGDKTQDERMKALEGFKNGTIEVLVATDVAARGLDIVELPVVINYDVPFAPEDYVHRIGRTGRAGASGLTIMLATGSDDRSVTAIERLTKQTFEIKSLGGIERSPRSGHRPERDRGEGRDRREGRGRPERSTGGAPSSRPVPKQPADDFFSKPYEPAAVQATGAEEAKIGGSESAESVRRPAGRVSALLGGRKK